MPNAFARAGRRILPTLPLSYKYRLNPAEWNRAGFYGLSTFVFVFTFVFSVMRLVMWTDPAGSYVAPAVATVAASGVGAVLTLAMLYVQYYQGIDVGPSDDTTIARDRLLVVEDDAQAADALRRILSRAGWQVDWAPTVTAAKLALANRPCWVLLDMMLPDGVGVDVLRAIRDGGLPIKVAVISAMNHDEILRRLNSLTPDAILGKPLGVEELARLIGGPGGG